MPSPARFLSEFLEREETSPAAQNPSAIPDTVRFLLAPVLTYSRQLSPEPRPRFPPRPLNFAQENQQRIARDRRVSLGRGARDLWDREVEDGLIRNVATRNFYTPQLESRPEAFMERSNSLGEVRRTLPEQRPNNLDERHDFLRQYFPDSPRGPKLFQKPRRNLLEYERNSKPQEVGFSEVRRSLAKENKLEFLEARVA